jgi:hypothetical protein
VLLSCTRQTQNSPESVQIPANEIDDSANVSDDDFASKYRSLDTDHVLLYDSLSKVLIGKSLAEGTLVSQRKIEGGDCATIVKKFSMPDSSVLILEKYDCGDHGFGSSQYIKKGERLIFVYEISINTLLDSSQRYEVSEKAVKFKNSVVLIREGRVEIQNLQGLKSIKLVYSREVSAQDIYQDITQKLINLGALEK